MAKFLDKDGLTHFWGKIKTLLAGKAAAEHTHFNFVDDVTFENGITLKNGNRQARMVVSADSDQIETAGNLYVGGNINVDGEILNGGQPFKDLFAEADHVHDAATTSKNGFMTSAMVTKLNGIEEGANKTIVDTALSETSTNPVQNKVVNGKIAKLNEFMEETVPTTYVKKENVDGSYSETSTNPIQNKVVAASISALNKFMIETVPDTYAKKTDIATAYKPMGSVATIPSIGTMDGGEVYNITAEFTTTTDFVEGAGKKYPAGTNIVLTAEKKWDVLAGFVDLSSYATNSDISDLQDQIDDIEAVTGSIDSITTTEIDTMMAG